MNVVIANTDKIVLIAIIAVSLPSNTLPSPMLLSMVQSADSDEASQDDHGERVSYNNNRPICLTKRMKRAILLEEIRTPSSELA